MVSCLLCAEDDVAVWGVLACGHSFCWTCSLRVRYLNEDPAKATLCCRCQKPSPYMILTRDFPGEEVDVESKWKVGALQRDRIWEEVKVDSPDLLDEISFLRDMYCPLWERCQRQTIFNSMEQLEKHLWAEHKMKFCNVCVSDKPAFLSEQTLYTDSDLRKHLSIDEACPSDPPNFHGHPLCFFCNTRSYSTTTMFLHMRENHFECDMCLFRLGKKNIFYPDLESIVEHWRRHHFFCDKCYGKHRVQDGYHPREFAFFDEAGYAAHEATHDGGKKAKQTVEVGFQFGGFEGSNRGRGGRRGGRGGYGGGQATSSTPPPPASETDNENEELITFVYPNRLEYLDLNLKKLNNVQASDGRRGGGRRGGRQQAHSASPKRHQEWEEDQGMSMKERNIQLMKKIAVLLGKDTQRFNHFRLISAEYLKNAIPTAVFYTHLQSFFGDNIDDVFSDLVSLLPDRDKQEGLRLMHCYSNSKERGVPDPPAPSSSSSSSRPANQPKKPKNQPSSYAEKVKQAGGGKDRGTTPPGRAKTPPPEKKNAFPTSMSEEFPALPSGQTGKKKSGSVSISIGGSSSSSSGRGRGGKVWQQKAQQRNKQ